MTTNKAVLQPAFVLHSRLYRDTSLLVDLFTMHFGRMSVVARGARGIKSQFRGILSPFLPLLVSFSGRSDLRTLLQAETNGISYTFNQKILLSGLYLNELLVKLLPKHEAYPELYQVYQNTLTKLVTSRQLEVELRLFEKCLLANLGYGLQLDYTVSNEAILPEKQYIFEFGHGFSQTKLSLPTSFLGKNLLALHFGTLVTIDELRDAKRFLRGVLQFFWVNKH